VGDFSGTVPTILAGDVPLGDDWDQVLDELVALSAAWSVWAPTLTNLTQGSGSVTALYRRVGKTLDYSFKFTYGAGSAVGTGPRFTLPYAPHSKYAAYADPMGDAILSDTGTAQRRGSVLLFSGSTVEVLGYSTTGILTGITATSPHTWAATDIISCAGTIELA
jgi:hypothetical protein